MADTFDDGIRCAIEWLDRVSMSLLGNKGGEQALAELKLKLRAELKSK